MNEAPYTCDVIDTIEAFATIRDTWNRHAGTNPFLRWEWMFQWWTEFGNRDELATVVVRSPDGASVAVAPWFRHYSRLQGTVIRQLGSGAVCSDYVSLLADPESPLRSQIVSALAALITDGGPRSVFAGVDLFEFEGHRSDDVFMTELFEVLTGLGVRVEREEFSASWATRLEPDWNSFETRLHRSFRRKTRKAAKRIDSQEVQLTRATSPESIASHWETLVSLHQRRRNSLGEPGCFADAAFERFLRKATMELADAGRAIVNVAHCDGQPLAANVEFTGGESIFMYQSGVDPDRMALEPGHLLLTHSIRHAITDTCTQFDFLRGDESYKALWRAERIPLCRTRVVAPRLTAAVRYQMFDTGKRVRNWARSLFPQVGPGIPDDGSTATSTES